MQSKQASSCRAFFSLHGRVKQTEAAFPRVDGESHREPWGGGHHFLFLAFCGGAAAAAAAGGGGDASGQLGLPRALLQPGAPALAGAGKAAPSIAPCRKRKGEKRAGWAQPPVRMSGWAGGDRRRAKARWGAAAAEHLALESCKGPSGVIQPNPLAMQNSQSSVIPLNVLRVL